jgi:hypothetical protein
MADLINFVRSLIGLGECENADEGTGEMMVDIQSVQTRRRRILLRSKVTVHSAPDM